MSKYNLPFEQVIKQIRNTTFEDQLGSKAHFEIAPYRGHNFEKPSSAIQAAVLLLLYPSHEQTHFVLIQRATYKGNHSNQISLPGGKKDAKDISLQQTALREANEEVNVEANTVQILGELTSVYIPNSNFIVSPFLSYSHTKPNFKAHPKEVENILEIPLSALFESNVIKKTKVELSSGLKIESPFLDLQNQVVWGATGMILNEFRRNLLLKL